jgi:hypothetical protein
VHLHTVNGATPKENGGGAIIEASSKLPQMLGKGLSSCGFRKRRSPALVSRFFCLHLCHR